MRAPAARPPARGGRGADLDRALRRAEIQPDSDSELSDVEPFDGRGAPFADDSDLGSGSDDESATSSGEDEASPPSDLPLGALAARLADGSGNGHARRNRERAHAREVERREKLARKRRWREAGSDDEEEEEEEESDEEKESGSEGKEGGRGGSRGRGRAGTRSGAVSSGSAPAPRRDKHAPAEASSKRPVSVLRTGRVAALGVARAKSLDPRFDSLAGGGSARGRAREAAEEVARRRYGFVYDEVLAAEKAEAQRAAKKTRSERARREALDRVKALGQAERQEQLRRRTAAVRDEAKRREKALVAKGKTPFFLKASERKKLELRAKYEELKKAGKLDKFLEKKRKKIAAKDHRILPVGRRE